MELKKIESSMYEKENTNIYLQKKMEEVLKNLKKTATNCQYKYLQNSVKKKIVLEQNSEKQFNTLIDLLNKDENNGFYLLLQLLLNKYFTIIDTIKLIDYIKINKNLKDFKIYDKIFKTEFKKDLFKLDQLKLHEYNISKLFSVFEKRFNEYFGMNYELKLDLLKGQKKYNDLYKLNNKINNYNYLDLGFMNSDKINLIKNKFKIEKNNVYGAYINKPLNFDYEYTIIKDNGNIDYPDEYFDLVTCWNFFEKIQNMNLLLKELRRITKKNGLILIYYKVTFSKEDYYLYCINEVIKYFKNKTFNKKEWKIYLKNYSFNRFLNFTEWNSIFYEYGFKTFGFGNYNYFLNYNPNIENKRFIFYIKKE